MSGFLDEETDRERSVGELDLAPFQARAARRGTDIARRYGGVIVADAVGLGKTRVALAIVETLRRDRRLQSADQRPVWVCVPARLRDQWRRKMTQAGFERFELLSHTQMSREDLDGPDGEPGVLLVDEAHRFRNPSTNRHRALADWTAEVPVVMATATPVCNSIWDLYHLFSLFVAEHDCRPVVGLDLEDAFERAEEGAFDLTALIERLVIRRTTPPTDG
ncbi:MAG: SNF2-related protein, partial [Bradymonadaceae bacterium]